MSVKKIAIALTGLTQASQKATKLLNELSENSFEGSALESEPLMAIGEVIRQLKLAKHEWELKEKYAGLSEEDIAAQQAAERETEVATLQQHFADRLNETAERIAAKPASVPVPSEEVISDHMKEAERAI